MHLMLDLETLATDSNAFIISIGAVKFNSEGLFEEFYQTVELPEKTEFTICPKTVGWWLSQAKEAQQALLSNVEPLRDVLFKFNTFYNFGISKVIGVWGNGSTFDNAILRNTYEKLGLKCPWHYRYDRCYRSTKYILPEEKFIRVGEHHNALDDAKSQALHLIKICKTAGIILK